MDVSHIVPVLKAGTVFSIMTEKTVKTIKGAPWPMLLKTSKYSVTTEVMDATPTWWAFTSTQSVVAKKGTTPRLYLLCAIAHGYGFGKSSFAPMGDDGIFDEAKTLSKAEVSRWLPVEGEWTCPFHLDVTGTEGKKCPICGLPLVFKPTTFKDGQAMTLPLDSILELQPLDGPDSADDKKDYKAIMALTS
jgi:hypothetical protein